MPTRKAVVVCFSAQADLVMGAVVTGVGVDALRHVRRRGDGLLGAIPVVLGGHLLVEAVVWLGLRGHVGAGIVAQPLVVDQEPVERADHDHHPLHGGRGQVLGPQLGHEPLDVGLVGTVERQPRGPQPAAPTPHVAPAVTIAPRCAPKT